MDTPDLLRLVFIPARLIWGVLLLVLATLTFLIWHKGHDRFYFWLFLCLGSLGFIGLTSPLVSIAIYFDSYTEQAQVAVLGGGIISSILGVISVYRVYRGLVKDV